VVTKGGLIGLAFALSRTALGGAPSPLAELIAGLVLGPMVAIVGERLAGSTGSRIAVLWLAVFTGVAAVMIEGAAFAPDLSPAAGLPLALLGQALVSLVVAATTVALIPAPGDRPQPAAIPPRRRSLIRPPLRLAAAAFVYVLLYFVTGAINFLLVTGPYYETHSGGLAVPPPAVVGLVAVAEGFLLAIGLLPLARRLSGSRWERAIISGSFLFVLGGVVPLIVQPGLPDVLRLASAVEIFCQKFPLGIAVVLLLGSAASSRASSAAWSAPAGR
jgi:hypothetical protein